MSDFRKIICSYVHIYICVTGRGRILVELHLESVFRFGIGRYFLNMWLTDIVLDENSVKNFGMYSYNIYVE
jgi:hypothetical protein